MCVCVCEYRLFLMGSLHGVEANALDCYISRFKFQLHYQFDFQINTLGKGITPLSSFNYRLITTITVLLQK